MISQTEWISVKGWKDVATGVGVGDSLVNLNHVAKIEKLDGGPGDEPGIRLCFYGDLQGECIEQFYKHVKTRDRLLSLLEDKITLVANL